MKPEQLRIGNIFQEEITKEIIKVIGLTENTITFTGNFESKWQAKPIELSEEILLKCGFDIDPSWKNLKTTSGLGDILIITYSNGTFIVIQSHEESLTFSQAVEISNGDSNFCWESFPSRPNSLVFRDMKYLHELQNLYLLLTGKELEINL